MAIKIVKYLVNGSRSDSYLMRHPSWDTPIKLGDNWGRHNGAPIRVVLTLSHAGSLHGHALKPALATPNSGADDVVTAKSLLWQEPP